MEQTGKTRADLGAYGGPLTAAWAVDDHDGDGTPDTDPAIFVPDADPMTTTDPLNPDTDGDGLDDGLEDPNRNGARDPSETDAANADTDGDGYNDGDEVVAGSDPTDPGSVPNRPPIANAGPDQLVCPGSATMLDGTGSTDPDGDMLSFAWLPDSSRDQ